MKTKYFLIPLLFVLEGCISLPKTEVPDFSEWQDYSFQLSDNTLVFTAPSSGYLYPRSRSIDHLDIYDKSIYHPIGKKIVFSYMAWDWRPTRSVAGHMGIGADIVVHPIEKTVGERSIKKLVDQKNRNGFQRTWGSERRKIPYTPIRFKHVLRFSENGPKWLVSDYPQGPPNGIRNPEAEELFTYPLDDTHFLTIYVLFMNNTYQRDPDGKKHLLWYNEAEAIADRILASVRIERTTPVPDIEYGATDIGVVSPSQIPYVDRLSERPPLVKDKR
ncbi:MAG: hypothetical protein VCD00_06995 [Candidatus Hydrogenedentota bacterium]